jgi:hypothetical protein
LPSFAFEEKTQETTTSQEAHRCLLHLRKKPRDDDELGASQLIVNFCISGKKPKDNKELRGSSLFSAPKRKTKK